MIDKVLQAKKAAGAKAADLIEDGMTIGLGTGSTAHEFISCLIERCEQGLEIQAVATSIDSERLAYEGGIPLVDIDTLTSLDLTIDGADQIDPQKRMIKGGGGALLREKIIAKMSKEMIVIVDESKLVAHFGSFPLPVEIIPFAYLATLEEIHELNLHGKLRMNGSQGKTVTDNGNYIYDIDLKKVQENPKIIHQTLLAIPGVVETGFFFDLAGRVIIGMNDGTVKILP